MSQTSFHPPTARPEGFPLSRELPAPPAPPTSPTSRPAAEAAVAEADEAAVAWPRRPGRAVAVAEPVAEPVAARAEPVAARGEGRTVVLTYSDGTEEVRAGGSRAWRNNNPGNMEQGEFTRAHGAIGAAGGPDNARFAVFPSAERGFTALVERLGTGRMADLTMDQAIERWAPPSENNTARYKDVVHDATGLPGSTRLRDMTVEQREALAGAIRRHEGWVEGTVTHRKPNAHHEHRTERPRVPVGLTP